MAAILIVDDQPIDRKVLATLLKLAGHSVVEASDGVEGLRVARRAPPDLVISDILMPTVDGYEFVRQMREVATLARTPVIFFTGAYHERDARALARQCGVTELLTKPIESRVMLATVDAVLASGKRPLTPEHDSSQFGREHMHVANSALESKVKALEASEQRMAAIVGFAHQIAAERDATALLEKVCRATRQVILAQYAIVVMLTDDGLAFRQIAKSGIDDETLSRMEPPGIDGPVFKQVIAERRPIRLTAPSGIAEASGLPAIYPLSYSSLIVPIASPSLVFGCLRLHNKLGSQGFTDRDEEVALALATHAGIAYENARLYDDLHDRTAALEHEIADRRSAEARTRLAMLTAQMGVWELDLTADRLEWSDSLGAIFGLTPTQAPTTNGEFNTLIHPDDRQAHQEAFERAFRDRTDLVNEFRTIWPDGTVHWIATRARLLNDEGGTPIRMIGAGMDLTARKSLEEQLRQAQKMEAVGQLAGGVAHDFNNLLTVIHGYAHLVLATFNADDRRRADVDEIVKAADRAAGLTRQLLAFSRKQILQPTLFDLNTLVINTSKMLRRLIGENIELVTILAPTPATVRADPGQLEQILTNLVVNARDAMQGGGRISIGTAHVVVDEAYAMQHVAISPGPFVLLSVTDTGVGIDEATKKHIFEPFFTTKERGRGTGLGLATVHGIVQQSGGRISVYSEPGHGATFTVYLPRAAAGVVEATVAEAEGTNGGSETILLVEDERAVRALSRTLLERAGYHVLDAANPEQAEEVFREHASGIDLLATDVIMPGSSGPSLFGRLSKQQPDLRVLYMSGYTDDAIVHHVGLGADVVFLQKPFTVDALMCKVREALDR